jgi:hypothetical protein
MEQRAADLIFQILDLLTGRPLADANARRGPGEVPFLCVEQKIVDIAPFHPRRVIAARENLHCHGFAIRATPGSHILPIE